MSRKIGMYEISVILFFAIVPIAGAVTEIAVSAISSNTSGVLLKWFAFSGIGLRLFSAGLKQSIQPSFTATEIFKADEKSYPIVREVGFSNISLGVLGILSFFFSDFRLAAAVTGGLYFGLAGFLRLLYKRDKNEVFTTITDFLIFLVLLVLVTIYIHLPVYPTSTVLARLGKSEANDISSASTVTGK